MIKTKMLRLQHCKKRCIVSEIFLFNQVFCTEYLHEAVLQVFNIEGYRWQSIW